jgi:hypothetical protein
VMVGFGVVLGRVVVVLVNGYVFSTVTLSGMRLHPPKTNIRTKPSENPVIELTTILIFSINTFILITYRIALQILGKFPVRMISQ